jgi:hypothetical protein
MKIVGILSSHQEVLLASNPQYQNSFQTLSTQNYQAVALDTLTTFGSLLLGVPQTKLSVEEKDLL